MILILDREKHCSNDTINIGSICDPDDDFALCTLENPWLDNEPYISCIPKGAYDCIRVNSPRYGNTFTVPDVEGRTHILFHWGNWEKNTLGCILLGKLTNSRDMIMDSRRAFGEFIKHTQDVDGFLLDII